MNHRHGAARIRRQKRGVQRDVANVSPGNAETGEPRHVEILRRRLGRKYAPPDLRAVRRVGKGKLDHKTKPAQKSIIDGRLQIGGQDRETAIGLHSLQQVTDLYVGVAIVTVFHFASFAKEGVGFVEEQHRAAFVGSVEHAAQVLFSFADVLADDLAQVDTVKIESQLVGENFSRHRLAGAAGAGEQRADAESAFAFGRKAPITVNFRALPHVRRDLAQAA